MVQAGAKRNAAEQQQEDTIYDIQLQAASAVPAIDKAPCLLHARHPFCVLVQSKAQDVSSGMQQISGQWTWHVLPVHAAVGICRVIGIADI